MTGKIFPKSVLHAQYLYNFPMMTVCIHPCLSAPCKYPVPHNSCLFPFTNRQCPSLVQAAALVTIGATALVLL